MNEDYWYYEENCNGQWIAVYAGYGLDQKANVELMEARKKEHPRAKLRLVHVTRERFSYRNRKAAK